MNRKAASVWFFIIELIAIILLITSVAWKINTYAKSETVIKINAAEDIRMMVDVLAGIPGDAVVQYPYDLSPFIVVLRSDRIALFHKGDSENTWITRKFFLLEGYVAEGVVEEKETLCLEKKDKKILLRECL